MNKPGDWMENPQTLANLAHMFAALAIVETAWILEGREFAFWLQLALIVYATVKEFWYDLRYETGETWKSSTEDFAGYVVGSLAAWCFYLVHLKIGGMR